MPISSFAFFVFFFTSWPLLHFCLFLLPSLVSFRFLFAFLLASVAFFLFLFYLLACASRQRLQIRTKWTFALLPWFCALTLQLQPSKSKGTLAQLNFCLFCICIWNEMKSKWKLKSEGSGGSKWRPEAKANKNKNPRLRSSKAGEANETNSKARAPPGLISKVRGVVLTARGKKKK